MSIEPYAVLFKAFTADRFVQRQLRRAVAAAPTGDVYLMIDETCGAAPRPIDFDRVIRYRESDVLAIGLPGISTGSLFWYNADYPLYYFHHLRPEYDVVVMVEYDAVVNVSLDAVVAAFRRDELDLIGHKVDKASESYWWTGSMLRFYDRACIVPYQICVTIFSARAIQHLAACRRQQGASGVSDPREWPVGEAFVGTELARAGFRLRDLSALGSLNRYDWWPPTHERELARCRQEAVIHPVLVGRRFLKSLFKSGFRSGVIVTMKLVLRAIGIVPKSRLRLGEYSPTEV